MFPIYLNGNYLSNLWGSLENAGWHFLTRISPWEILRTTWELSLKGNNKSRHETNHPAQDKRQRRWKSLHTESLRWKACEIKKCNMEMLSTMCFVLPAPVYFFLYSAWPSFQWARLHQDTMFMQLPCSPCAALWPHGNTKKGQKPFCALWSMLVTGWLLNNSKKPRDKGTVFNNLLQMCQLLLAAFH